MISKRANGSEPGGPERIDMFCSGHLHEQQAQHTTDSSTVVSLRAELNEQTNKLNEQLQLNAQQHRFISHLEARLQENRQHDGTAQRHAELIQDFEVLTRCLAAVKISNFLKVRRVCLLVTLDPCFLMH